MSIKDLLPRLQICTLVQTALRNQTLFGGSVAFIIIRSKIVKLSRLAILQIHIQSNLL